MNNINKCFLIRYMKFEPEKTNGKCDGFARGENDDEPCNVCKTCQNCTFYEEGD